MGGFMMGQMFAGQSKTASFNFVAIRVDKGFDMIPVLEETIKDGFFESPSQVSLELEFTKKTELKVWNKPKKRGQKPLLIFPLCYYSWGKKDIFLCLALRNAVGKPIPLNMSFLRNLLQNLDSKKVKYEIW